MSNTLPNRNYRYLLLVKLDFIHNIVIQIIKIISFLFNRHVCKHLNSFNLEEMVPTRSQREESIARL